MKERKDYLWASLFFAILAVVCLGSLAQAKPHNHRAASGAVYTMSNAVEGNSILVFDRHADGSLTAAGSYATDGYGTGEALGNQGGVVLSHNQRWLYAVNAGSNDISIFAVLPRGLKLIDVVYSEGDRPISLALDRKLLYVLHAGEPNDITAFTIDHHGRLTPLAGSTRPLSANQTAPAQISFSPDGEVLVVTEKGTNFIDTYLVGRDGRAEGPRISHSVGNVPFGFAFGKRDQLIVSEAGSGSLSSYLVDDDDGTLEIISPGVSTTETAACWVVITNDGRFAYTTNAGTGSISGFLISHDGSLSLLDEDGRTGVTGDGSAPIDMALSGNDRFLYTLNSGNGTIGAFRVNLKDGSLKPLAGIADLPGSANGLAAR